MIILSDVPLLPFRIQAWTTNPLAENVSPVNPASIVGRRKATLADNRRLAATRQRLQANV